MKGGKKKRDGVDLQKSGGENVELNGRIATMPKRRRT